MFNPPVPLPRRCPDATTLKRLLNNELAQDTGEVESHVNSCPSCQETLELLVGSVPSPLVPTAEMKNEHQDYKPPLFAGHQPLGRINAGGMGVVWRVRDLEFGRDLAAKVMKSEASGKPDLVQRFIREAQISAQLTHPFIVPVHAMGQLPDGRSYYTMKLVEGQTLATQLKASCPSGPRRMEVIQIFAQVCQAVAFAHGKGVIHRDLKPQNIMLGQHGEVQVMDWGLAKVLAEEGRGEDGLSTSSEVAKEVAGLIGTPEAGDPNYATQRGAVMGTWSYMPPEQARGEVALLDPRSDVFSLGAILCEILTGQPPYTGDTLHEVLRKAKTADLTEAWARLAGCRGDTDLVQLAKSCLAANREERPQNAGAVAKALTAHLSQVQERLQQERLAREREQVRTAEERRRRKLWMGLVTAVLTAIALATVAGSYWLYQSGLRRQQIDQTLSRAEDLIHSGGLTEAGELLEQAERNPGLDGSVEARERLGSLAKVLQLVEELDKVRLTRVKWTNGDYNCSSALEGYRQAFARAGINPLVDDPEQVAQKISGSLVRQRLVAALDDWAYVAERERKKPENRSHADQYRQQRDRLLHVARLADPDPELKDKIRSPRCWGQPEQIRSLANDLLGNTTVSAELLVLVGALLEPEDRAVCWRKSLPQHADDFWLNAELGTLLMIQARSNPSLPGGPVTPEVAALAAEAAGHYQTALALRPQAVGVYLDLAAALAIKGDLNRASAYLEQAIRLEPDNPEPQQQLANTRRLRAMRAERRPDEMK